MKTKLLEKPLWQRVILFQNLLTSAVPILLFIVFLQLLKKDFADEMYLKIKGRWQWGGVLVLLAVGCFFQLLKEKTGTIWIPALLHAVWDFIVP